MSFSRTLILLHILAGKTLGHFVHNQCRELPKHVLFGACGKRLLNDHTLVRCALHLWAAEVSLAHMAHTVFDCACRHMMNSAL